MKRNLYINVKKQNNKNKTDLIIYKLITIAEGQMCTSESQRIAATLTRISFIQR